MIIQKIVKWCQETFPLFRNGKDEELEEKLCTLEDHKDEIKKRYESLVLTCPHIEEQTSN